MTSTFSRRRFTGMIAITACSLATLRLPAAFAHNDMGTPEPGEGMGDMDHDMTMAAGVGTGAIFMTITNAGAAADTLVGAKAAVAKLVEIHEMKMDGDVMIMAPLAAGLEIPAGGSVDLMPGGYHIMLFGLKQDLMADSSFDLTVHFASAGEITLPVPVMQKAAAEAMPPTETYTLGDLTITAVWSRPAPALLGELGAGMAGGFLTLANAGAAADRLVMADATICQLTEIHEMKQVGDVMEMSPLPDGLEIPAAGSVALAPGGYHLMFIGLLKDLVAGYTFDIDLHFETAGMVTVQAVVMELEEGKATPPAATWTVGDITIAGVWSRPAPAMAADDGMGHGTMNHDGMGTPDAGHHMGGMDHDATATPSM
jgi:copper(I)-binding protein